MKVALLHIDDPLNPNVYGDFAGGFGAGFVAGKSLLSRAVSKAKHHGLSLPLMSFGYLSAIFHSQGHMVTSGTSLQHDADLTLIHSSLTGWQTQVQAARTIKERGLGKVGFIGPFSGTVSEIFQESADFVIQGEPEEAGQRLASGELLSGLVKSSPLKKLDSLPFPDWRPFSFLRYTYFPSLLGKPIYPILASRGCPDSCSYCPYKVQYSSFRARSVENVIAEMKFLKEKGNASGFLFRDPFFTFSRKRTEKFAQGLLSAGISVPWVCETKIDSLDEDLIALLARTGLKTVNVGIESVKADILESAGRSISEPEKVKKLLDFCNKKGVKVAGFFILGWPDDTAESIEDTINYALDLNPHIATFTLFTPFPGTPAFSQLEHELITTDWSQFDVMNAVYRHDRFSPMELLELKERAYLRFYYRPRYVYNFLKRLVRS